MSWITLILWLFCFCLISVRFSRCNSQYHFIHHSVLSVWIELTIAVNHWFRSLHWSSQEYYLQQEDICFIKHTVNIGKYEWVVHLVTLDLVMLYCTVVNVRTISIYYYVHSTWVWYVTQIIIQIRQETIRVSWGNPHLQFRSRNLDWHLDKQSTSMEQFQEINQ